MSKLLQISEVSKLLNLTNNKTDKPSNYILRYWQKEFSQIKPKIINRRRYYSEKQVEQLKLIKYLLKDLGLSISGVKKILKSNSNTLDVGNSNSLQAVYKKDLFKTKVKKILYRINKLKKNG
tara:strand:- start:51 stop:416 length:366 start_codon:yes stop_codon:yes gene_type:complete